MEVLSFFFSFSSSSLDPRRSFVFSFFVCVFVHFVSVASGLGYMLILFCALMFLFSFFFGNVIVEITCWVVMPGMHLTGVGCFCMAFYDRFLFVTWLLYVNSL